MRIIIEPEASEVSVVIGEDDGVWVLDNESPVTTEQLAEMLAAAEIIDPWIETVRENALWLQPQIASAPAAFTIPIASHVSLRVGSNTEGVGFDTGTFMAQVDALDRWVDSVRTLAVQRGLEVKTPRSAQQIEATDYDPPGPPAIPLILLLGDCCGSGGSECLRNPDRSSIGSAGEGS